MCVFGYPVFDVVRDEDSAFRSRVGIVCVVVGFVHVSCVPVLGFLEEYYGVFAKFRGHMVAGFFEVFRRAFV